ncbi:MAG: RDD family protein [Myxococcota bacterium]
MTQRLDTLRQVETPEGVRLAIRVAGPVPRALAWLIDMMIRSFGYTVIGNVLGVLGQAGSGIMLVIIFFSEWFYPVLFEVLWDGQTPGKRALSLAVVHDDGRPVSWGASMLRNLARTADFLPFGYLFGLMTMVSNADFKRLGDWAARTVVTYRDPKRSFASAPDEDVTPRPAGAPLTLAEQRALLDYADRREGWSEARRLELAGLLAPVTAGKDEDAEKELRRVVRWLRGQR